MDAPSCAVVGAALVEAAEGLAALLTSLVVEAVLTPLVEVAPSCAGVGAVALVVRVVGPLYDVEAGWPPL